MLNLLIDCSSKYIIHKKQYYYSFNRLYDRIDDLVLDVPNAKTIIDQYKSKLIDENVLPKTYQPSVF